MPFLFMEKIMSIESKFGFIGWCNEDNHDKVWGYFYRPTPRYDAAPEYEKRWIGRNICIFWAARGKAMRFKADITGHELQKLVSSKLNKGYIQITEQKLFEIWPTFIQEAEAKLMWEVLAGKVK
jgi:hypothetical protein